MIAAIMPFATRRAEMRRGARVVFTISSTAVAIHFSIIYFNVIYSRLLGGNYGSADENSAAEGVLMGKCARTTDIGD